MGAYACAYVCVREREREREKERESMGGCGCTLFEKAGGWGGRHHKHTGLWSRSDCIRGGGCTFFCESHRRKKRKKKDLEHVKVDGGLRLSGDG